MPPKDATGTGAGYAAGVKAEVAIARVRAEVANRQAELEEQGLVCAPRGNVSARVASADLFVIAPADSSGERVAPERTVLCDLEGTPLPDVPGSDRIPPTDVSLHAEIYRHVPSAGAIVHTDSPYALAWAARGEDLPILTRTGAEELGGPVRLTGLDLADADSWAPAIATAVAVPGGVALVTALGVFVAAETLRDATRRAKAVEDAARQAHLVSFSGPAAAQALPRDVIDVIHRRTQRDQPSTAAAQTSRSGRGHN